MMNTPVVPLSLSPSDTVELRPTLAAMMAVCSVCGGVQPALQKVMAMDISTIAAVIAAGSGRKMTETLVEAVYQAGIITLIEPVSEYLLLLRNGGKVAANSNDQPASEGQPAPENPL